MQFLARERETFRTLLPGLDDALGQRTFEHLESPESDGVALFRDAGGPGLLIPEEHRGRGAGALEGVRVQRALAARAPSLAIATTMHHFSSTTLLELWRIEKGMEWMVLQAIGEGKLLLASGFAEGVRGQGTLTPTMRGRREGGKILVSGVKKPCSLSRSMDLLTASITIDAEDGGPPEFAVAMIPSTLPGITIEPFWNAPVLRGAESDAVILTDVAVELDLVVGMGQADPEELDTIQTAGFIWFALLITASYVGIASALAELVLLEGRGDPPLLLAPAMELDATMASLEGVARALDEGDTSAELLTRALLCRYAAQDAINRAVAGSIESLGGMAFIGGGPVSYLASASRALAFHPPGRPRNGHQLLAALRGDRLVIT